MTPTPAESSPRTRGSSRELPGPADSRYVFPAHAGVVHARPSAPAAAGLPRARGGRPSCTRRRCGRRPSSPRTRGSSGRTEAFDLARRVFPAHAGVVLANMAGKKSELGLPRARGGRPSAPVSTRGARTSSPRTRGSSRTGTFRRKLYLGLPRARGGRPPALRFDRIVIRSSPRTRGSSLTLDRLPHRRRVFPAHAGVVPRSARTCAPPSCLPRARGGRPPWPRSRSSTDRSSPRTRGSSCLLIPVDLHPLVFPAHAGVVPPRAQGSAWPLGLPAHAGVVP